MNHELEWALARFDPAEVGVAPGWEQVVLVRNTGPIGTSRALDLLVRGFDLLILGSDGKPARYCKVRSVGYDRLRHENETLEMFRGSSQSNLVPEARGGNHGQWAVQVARFLEGPLLIDGLRATRGDALEQILTKVLTLAHQLSTAARELADQYRERPLSLARECEESLAYLGQVTHLRPRPATLGRLVEGIDPVPSCPQHGDLWSSNVIMARGGWRIIDFEHFGDTMVPLYDVFHLLRTQCELYRSKPWVEQLADDGAEGKSSRRIIFESAARYGLGSEQILGCFVYYVLHQAATTHRDPLRAPDAKVAAMRQLERMCDMNEKSTLAQMLGRHV